LFLVFEGGDGAGKSTQARLLASAIRRFSVAGDAAALVVETREPGGTEFGRAIREALLHGGEVAPAAEALAYAADRAQHVAEVVAPALARGAVVISDRHLDSSIAYQVEGRGLAEAEVRAANALGLGGLVPDLTLLLDLPVAAAEARGRDATDRLENAGRAFHERVGARYRALAAAAPGRYAVLDAARPIDLVWADVAAAVAPLLVAAGHLPATAVPAFCAVTPEDLATDPGTGTGGGAA
jgi:dTMP kinase